MARKKQQPKKKKIIERLVADRNIERRKAEGWKVVKKHEDRHQIGGTDLTLMTKEV